MLIGIALIALGMIASVYQGITYTTREKVVDLGPLKITAQNENTIPLPPILGGLARAADRPGRRCRAQVDELTEVPEDR